MRIVVKDEQAGVNDRLSHQWDVIQHVLSLVYSCRGIHVASERSADALKPVQDALSREILGAIEAHVLKEMSQAVLVRSLLDSADICGKIELSPLGRLVVMPYVICQAIVKLTNADCRIVWQLRSLLCACYE